MGRPKPSSNLSEPERRRFFSIFKISDAGGKHNIWIPYQILEVGLVLSLLDLYVLFQNALGYRPGAQKKKNQISNWSTGP